MPFRWFCHEVAHIRNFSFTPLPLFYLGPAVVLSFLVGGFVTLLNALCFTEYAAKTPRTGAQYTYMYETIGEGVAFIVGWTIAIGKTISGMAHHYLA